MNAEIDTCAADQQYQKNRRSDEVNLHAAVLLAARQKYGQCKVSHSPASIASDGARRTISGAVIHVAQIALSLALQPLKADNGGMIERLRMRYLDLLGSIYIYNEHRGYTAIDRVLEAVRARAPDDAQLIADIEKHRADERRHYLMFRRWFELRGIMPLAVGRTCGHIDRFVEIMFRTQINDLDTKALIERDDLFERLCRVISLTEQRGHRQVEILLRHPVVRQDRVLMRIFRIIEKDEPSHWAPYDGWLKKHGKRDPKWWERMVDGFIHSELLFVKLPILFLTPRLTRRVDWADADEPSGRQVTARPMQPVIE